MEAEIFRNCRALQTGWPESQLYSSLRRAIDAIRESVASFFAGSGMAPLIREPSQRVDYFYPLYYIGAKVTPDDIRERAIMAGTEFSGAKGESYSRALEIVSYVWYVMFILDAYLSAQIKRILNTPIDQLTLRDAEEQLKRIRDSRALVHDTLEEYGNIRVSLWASIIRIFDKMFEVVDVDRIEQSVNGKLEILGYVHKDIIDRIERNHNFEMSRAVFVLQRVGFALAATLGIMPLLMTAVRNTAPYGPVQWMYPTLVEWMYPALGALILVFTVVAASRIAQLQWQRRSKKTRFL
jgi:hypothetical protein